jgi:hypothetical protein
MLMQTLVEDFLQYLRHEREPAAVFERFIKILIRFAPSFLCVKIFSCRRNI